MSHATFGSDECDQKCLKQFERGRCLSDIKFFYPTESTVDI